MAKTVKVRVLVDTQVGDQLLLCNTVAELDEATAKDLVASGAVDDNKAAVKHALGASAQEEATE